jgi:hypothetical protein
MFRVVFEAKGEWWGFIEVVICRYVYVLQSLRRWGQTFVSNKAAYAAFTRWRSRSLRIGRPQNDVIVNIIDLVKHISLQFNLQMMLIGLSQSHVHA